MVLRSFRSVFDLSRGSGKPTDSQLNKINERLHRSPLSESDVFVFPAVASNRNVDSYYSIMDDSSLRNYAQDYNKGLSVLQAHNDRAPIATGRTFESTFDPERGETLLWGYIARGINLGGGLSTDDVIRGIETGTVQDGSIRFSGGYDECEICHQRLYSRDCDHMPGREYTIPGSDKPVLATYRIINARAKEYSLVAIGATPDAGIVRKAHLLKERGLITFKELQPISRRLNFNLRTAIEGEEYAKFSFEGEVSDDDGDDAENIDADPATGNMAKKDKDLPDQYVSTDSDMDGRSSSNQNAEENMNEEEISLRYWENYLKTNMADLSAENIAEVKRYIEACERKEKNVPVPVLKANTHTHVHSHGDQAHSHEHAHHYGPMDNHSHDHDQPGTKEGVIGDYYSDDTEPEKVRFIKPFREFTIEEVLRASVIPVGADKGVPDAGEMDMAGLIMPGQDPLQDVPYKVWETTDGPPTPAESDKLSEGDTSLEIPELHIEPSGIIKFLYNGKEAVSGGVGVGGMIPMSSSMKGDYEGEIREIPIKIRLDETNLRAMVIMARDGAYYRYRLMKDMVRFGCLKDGNSFDKDFHVRIANKMTTHELDQFVQNLMRSVENKFKAGELEELSTSDFFPNTPTRQTVGSGGKGPAKNGNSRKDTYNPAERNELFSDRV